MKLAQLTQALAQQRQSSATPTDIVDLETSLSALEDRVADLEAFATSAVATLADHESRITALEP